MPGVLGDDLIIISGQVKDEESKIGIDSAIVRLSDPLSLIQDPTDSLGVFSITIPPFPEDRIYVSKESYEPFSQLIEGTSDISDLVLFLTPLKTSDSTTIR